MQRMLELLTTGLLAALLVVLSAALPYICAILAQMYASCRRESQNLGQIGENQCASPYACASARIFSVHSMYVLINIY